GIRASRIRSRRFSNHEWPITHPRRATMNLDLTIKNYRCFPDAHPVQLKIQNGFTALLGINNAGKSSLLKFFFEFRHLFAQFTLGNVAGITAAARGNPQPFNLAPNVSDTEEMFCNLNGRDIEFRAKIFPTDTPIRGNIPLPKELIITV